MSKAIYILLILLFLFLHPINAQQAVPQVIYAEAQILDISKTTMKVKVIDGSLKDKVLNIQVLANSQPKSQPQYKIDDHVIVSYSMDAQGNENIFIVDIVRKNQLLWLFALFMTMVIVIGRWKGVSAFFGMVFSFVIIGRFIIPNIMIGSDPVLISIFAAALIVPTAFYIAHGISWKTTVSVISTILTLILTAFLSYLFIELTRLTGTASEEVMFLQFEHQALNIKNLLLAGIIIGAMGVLDDITISQTSIVETVYEHNRRLSFVQLFQAGMKVGRDHIASLVNTLVLVYAGTSLPLFILFYNANMPYSYVVNQELITTEIVRTLVSSIGIIAAVPITTFLACYTIMKKKII